jgi:hypothetical protein
MQPESSAWIESSHNLPSQNIGKMVTPSAINTIGSIGMILGVVFPFQVDGIKHSAHCTEVLIYFGSGGLFFVNAPGLDFIDLLD